MTFYGNHALFDVSLQTVQIERCFTLHIFHCIILWNIRKQWGETYQLTQQEPAAIYTSSLPNFAFTLPR